MAYFAHVDPSAPEPSLVRFYDTGALHYPDLPPAAELKELTPAQWANRMATPMFAGGQFVARPGPTAAQRMAAAVARLGDALAQHQAAGVYFTPASSTTSILFGTTPVAMQNNAAAGVTGMTIAADGTPVRLSQADVTALLTKAQAYLAACVAAYAVLHGLVLADPAADISAGWPANT